MDIIKVTPDGAVVAFHESECHLLADALLAADSTPETSPLEAMHACFQALALLANALDAASVGHRVKAAVWDEYVRADGRLARAATGGRHADA